MGTYQLVVNVEFSGSHFLRGYDGCCSRMHGHNFKVQARVCGEKLNTIGMLIDFKTIKADLNKIVERFDHQVANDVPPFDQENPTAENMARYIHQELSPAIREQGATLESIGVWETDSYGAVYTAAG